jgi:hypothetical protein
MKFAALAESLQERIGHDLGWKKVAEEFSLPAEIIEQVKLIDDMEKVVPINPLSPELDLTFATTFTFFIYLFMLFRMLLQEGLHSRTCINASRKRRTNCKRAKTDKICSI